mgnify:FL=1
MTNAVCPTCTEEFKRVGSHWARGSCPYPQIPPRKQEMVLGLLMGDGSIPTQPDGRNGVFHVPMVNRQFLEWYDNRMGLFTTGVSLKKTAEELAENNRESGFSPNAKAENYHDMYTVWSRSHPYFTRLRSWYESGTKRIPVGFELTPEIAKFWYISDGFLDVDRDRTPRAEIRTHTESDRSDFLLDLFREHGFDPNFRRGTVRFSRDETRSFLDWMGNPPPGFEYKWVLDSRERYDRLKTQAYGEARAL